MKKTNIYIRTLTLLILFALIFITSSCNDSDEVVEPIIAEQTVFMYMPWSGEGIYKNLTENISAFEESIKNNNGLNGRNLIVFISANASTAYLINIYYKNNECRRDTLKKYIFNIPEYTTANGIQAIMADVITNAPAQNYAMIIGCHGMGWIPKGTDISYSKRNNMKSNKTRYFGHSSDESYQTNITTLAEGLKSTGIKMNYILFDDCYMSNIETAYDLKDVTNYMIASTCEIMLLGMPYDLIGINLLKNDFKGVCEGFYSFYSNYVIPCGTIGVTDCRELEKMAAIMKEINTFYADDAIDTNDIQTLDGFNPAIFFDFGDYVNHICEDNVLLSEFNSQLDRLVPYKANTETYYSDFTKKQRPINHFSGITISDPTINTNVKKLKEQTRWYIATH